MVTQKVKTQQPCRAPGQLPPLPQVSKYQVFRLYTQAELVDLGYHFQQKPPELLATWLLWLRDVGVDGLLLTGPEMGKLASVTTHPTLQQWLQNAHQTWGNYSLLEWVMALSRAAWPNAGDLLATGTTG